ncbi:asparaginase [Hydrocarboniphaga effusa]|jgi:L-asparaginase|uniref:asparaginase n=1 Tax=Hydrocarboniphaga effusa TaxID=243629 RepID=UPI0035AF16D4
MIRNLLLSLALIATALASAPASAQSSAGPLPKVRLFTTGGTIQSRGAHRQKLMEYSDGKVTPEQLVNDLPELKEVAQLEYMEISNVGSPSVNTEIQLRLAKEINAWLAKPESAGAVVTHGTATLEETAYFLNLVVKSDKPVVLVGAMRPFTAVSRDGPFNLYNAVRVAGSPKARGMGVMILLNDEINAARDTTKGNTYRMDTFVARDLGPLGYADSDQIVFYRKPTYRHTSKSEFDVSKLSSLPRVDITYGYQEDDGAAIDAFVAAGAKGLVLTGGDKDAIKRAQDKGVVIVSSDRKGSGRVVESEKSAAEKRVTSDNLLPMKARILLRLALTKTSDPKEIQRMFNQY